MELAKPRVDIGLCTNNLNPMLHFWQNDAGLRFDHVLPIRRGQKQHRHDALGSVVKINHYVEQLPAAPPSGYRELIVARQDRTEPECLADPDGNRVSLVPFGHEGADLDDPRSRRQLDRTFSACLHCRYADMIGFRLHFGAKSLRCSRKR